MKVYITFFLFFASSIFAQAQIVNIPDINLKHILTTDSCVDLNDDGIGDADADTNDDGEIQESEAAAVEYLILNGADPSMLTILDVTGLEAFVNLKSFDSGAVSFGNPSNVGVDILDFTSSSNMERININQAELSSGIDVSGLSNLTRLKLAFVSKLPEQPGDGYGTLPVNIEGCISLIDIDVLFSNVDMDYCQAPMLEDINYIGVYNLVDLNFNCLPNLKTLDVGEININSLYLKNGSVLEGFSSFSIVGGVLCIDNNQSELNSLGNAVDDFEYITTTCEVSLGENIVFGSISANTSITNGDCETNDLPSGIQFDFIQDNTTVLNIQTNNTSQYEIPLGQGDYQVEPSTTFSDGYDIVPNHFEVSFTGNSGELFEQDICLEPRVEIVDGIEIKFYPYYYNPDPSINRFDSYVVLKNTNLENYSGQLELNFDGNYSVLVDSGEFPDSENNGVVIWNNISIGPDSIFSMYLRISYNDDTHPNFPLFAGDQLSYDLFLTNTQSGGRQVIGGNPSFRLIQTIDAAEQTLSDVEIEEPVSTIQMKVYPNPSNQIIYLTNTNSVEDLTMHTINGQLMNSITYEQNDSDVLKIDISHLASGIYFLTIQTKTSAVTKKIIKN